MQATNENAPPQTLFEKVLLRSWEYRHRRLFWGVRLVVGVVLIGLGIFALATGSWWALAFWVVAAADFYLGYRIYQRTQQPASDVTPTRV
jgi:uncharacterized membrane protein